MGEGRRKLICFVLSAKFRLYGPPRDRDDFRVSFVILNTFPSTLYCHNFAWAHSTSRHFPFSCPVLLLFVSNIFD